MLRHITLRDCDPRLPTILLLNGGGQPPYTKFDRLTKLFEKFSCNLVAVELPGHGKNPFNSIVDANTMLTQFRTDITEICQKYQDISIFGYSLGGLLALQATNYIPFRLTVVCGAAMVIHKEQEIAMQTYTSEEFVGNQNWDDVMSAYHKTGWEELLYSLRGMLYEGSTMFLGTLPKLEHTKLIHILGDSDTVASYKDHQDLSHPNYKLYVLSDTSHFDYFTRRWEAMEELLISVLKDYLELM